MCRLSCLALISLSCLTAFAQDPVSAPLPDSLRQGASVVKRQDLMEIDIESPRRATLHHRYVYTILNGKGDGYGAVYTFYDQFHTLESATAILFDAAGKEVRKIKKSELEDWNLDGLGILMMDTRVKYYKFVSRSYPYTIAYDEEITLNGLFALPPLWRPQPSPLMSVVSCSLVIHAPADYPLQYRSYRLPAPVTVTEKKGIRTYTWQVADRPIAKEELYAPDWYSRESYVRLAPGEFEVGGYKGNFDSWTDLGKFIDGLYQGRGQLPEAARQKVHALVDGLTSDTAKIRVLYGFLQANTHYVAVELGIGGWQPYAATSVYEKRYGDCKALANYMVTLLNEAGIRASPVLIRAGANAPPIDSGFACNEFNHVIAAAFPGNDTVWLECTSATMPPGFLGSFTADRYGLLLDSTGGHLVHTPVYGLRDNRLARFVNGHIGEDGALEATVENDYSGLEEEQPQGMIDHLTKKELEERVRQSFGLSDCTISNLGFNETMSAVPEVVETLQLASDHFATVTGSRMIVLPGPFLRRAPRLQEDGGERTDGFEINQSAEETDSVVFSLPPGYAPENNLINTSLSGAFGSYRIRSSFQDGVLTIACRWRQRKGVYPAGDYGRFVRLLGMANREGNREIVFVKK